MEAVGAGSNAAVAGAFGFSAKPQIVKGPYRDPYREYVYG